MSAIANGSLQPTWFGHVTTARDALILFEACLNGTLHHVPRRPHDRERAQLIKSGCVFIYEENASGIKRWTDGVPWSPSRILGNFLVYRELMKPFPPGEKKRATKKNSRPQRTTKPGEPYPRTGSTASPPSPPTPCQAAEPSPEARESERALIGSLVDSYGFKEGGLVKKTMSVLVHGVHHHLVSYYTMEDALEQKLNPPSADPRLAGIEPRHDLVARQSFRAPLDETDEGCGAMAGHAGGYHYPHPGYPRPDMLMSAHAHNTPMNLSYSGMALTSPGYSTNMPSYAPTQAISQGYSYPAAAAMQPSLKQETYASYPGGSYNNGSINRPPLSIATDRRSSLNQQSQYPYRQGPTTPQSARPALESISQAHDTRALDMSNWGGTNRMVTSASQGGIYSATAPPQPHSAGPYSTGHSQWNNTVPPQSLPRIEGAWSSADTHWSSEHMAAGGRQHTPFTQAQQHNT